MWLPFLSPRRGPNSNSERVGSIMEGPNLTHNHLRAENVQHVLNKDKWPEGSGEANIGRVAMESDLNREEDQWQWVRKLEMPIFSGDNQDGWLFPTERYFEVTGLTKKEKMGVVIASLDGDALLRLQWAEAKEPFRS